MNKRVIIVHRWEGEPKKDWYEWLKKELEKKGFKVEIPSMPKPEHPTIDAWVSYLTQIISEPYEDTILIGHSVGCQMILRFLETLPEPQKVGKVILVAGFAYKLMNLTDDEWIIAMPWLETAIDFEKVKTKAASFTAIFSDDDPYVPLKENSKVFKEKLGAKIIVEHDKGHFTEMPKERPDLLELF